MQPKTSNSATRVVHVSSAHPATDNRIRYRECATLADAGYEVSLVAVEPDTPAGRDEINELLIPRLPRLKRVLISGPRAIRTALNSGADILHLHDPELIWAVPFLRISGKKVIYDAHEDLPVQVVSKPYVNRISRPILASFAHFIVRIARLSNHVVVATETIAERFPENKTSVVHNYPPLRIEEGTAPNQSDRPGKVVYVGGITKERGAEVMVSAVGAPDFPENWSFDLAGTASESLLSDLKRMPGWERTTYLGQIPSAEARNLLLNAKVGLVLLQSTKAYRESLPTKMFEYFAAGVPVIASDFPLWRTIVEEHECGLLVNQESPEDIARALKQYSENPDLLELHSTNARKLAVEQFNWQPEGETLVRAYQSILGGKS